MFKLYSYLTSFSKLKGKDFKMAHPLSTSVKVNEEKGRKLIDHMNKHFDEYNLN